jgi:hypothetical protein
MEVGQMSLLVWIAVVMGQWRIDDLGQYPYCGPSVPACMWKYM